MTRSTEPHSSSVRSRPRRRRRVVAALLVGATLAAACGTTDDAAGPALTGDLPGESDSAESAPSEYGTSGDASSLAPAPGSADFDELATRGAAEDATDSAVPGDPAAIEEVGLRAGSVDDNELWEEYLLYLQEAQAAGLEYSPLYVEGRRVIQVRTPEGAPVLDARIVVVDAEGVEIASLRTHADGRALFFAPALEGDPADQQQSAPSYTAIVSKDGVEVRHDLGADLTAAIELDVDPSVAPIPLDIQFLVDATGSMSDEIERLKANMISVADEIGALPGTPDVRFAVTTYRDRGEEYVTRTVEFTGDVDAFTEELRSVVADGGGDEPEALNEGLAASLAEAGWRDEAAVRLLFLVADAPPHLDYADGPDYPSSLVAAASTGVKIFPVASSGANFQAELIFRQMAQYTSGRFVFLTYGADGVTPGDETQFNVDDYSVLSLDELIVKLVDDELASLDAG